MQLTIEQRVDWFRLIVTMANAGLSEETQAEHVGVSRRTVGAWKNGTEPSFVAGSRLVALYCSTMQVEEADVPVRSVFDPLPQR